jgi:hypothetical protein
VAGESKKTCHEFRVQLVFEILSNKSPNREFVTNFWSGICFTRVRLLN